MAWSKNAGPDVLARRAWRLADVEDRLDELTLRAWVSHDGNETEIQPGRSPSCSPRATGSTCCAPAAS